MASQLTEATDSLKNYFYITGPMNSLELPGEWTVGFIAEVMEAISTNSKLIEFARLNLETDKGAESPIKVNMELYTNEVMPSLVGDIVAVVSKDFPREIDASKLKIFMAKDIHHPQYISAVEYVVNDPTALRDRVCLARNIIQTVIPSVVNQALDVSYGLHEKHKIAVPFKAGDVRKQTEFANTYETMVLTMLYHIRKEN